jgi:hypothetical protein
MTQSWIDVGHAQRTCEGEAETGDRCVIKLFDDRALIGVIDGVGHGAQAARAAAAAAEVLESFDDEPLDRVMQLCHERLAETRGAAMMLGLFDARDGLLKWVGAGNVAAMLLRTEPSGNTQRRELLVRSGVVGEALPSIAVSATAITLGDIVVFATDGLRRGFVDGVGRLESPSRLAERLLSEYQLPSDDALVVVARTRSA